MAITIEDQPYEYTPIGQRLMLVASSDNVANAGFRFVFDFGSFQVNVQPNAANKGVLDLAPIFRESLQHNPSYLTASADTENSSVAFISCTIKEGWLVDGVFTVSGLGMADIDDVYAFLAEYQVADGYKPDPNVRYGMDGTTKYLMSERTIDTHKWIEAPSRGLSSDWVYIPTRLSDWGVMYAPSSSALLVDNDFDIAVFTSYDDTDTIIDTQFLTMADNPSIVNVIGAFYANINALGALDLTGAKYYTIQLGKETAFPIYTPSSRVYCFYLVADDCRFDNVRLGWTNTCGGVDYFNFTKKSELSFNYDRKQYQKVVGSYNASTFGFNTYDRGLTERSPFVEKMLRIRTDFLTEGQFEYLKNLIYSESVYIINPDGSATPVVIDSNNYTAIKSRSYVKNDLELMLKFSNDYTA